MTVANLITGFRLLPFALFVFFAHQEQIAAATVMFLIAWGLDAIDGIAARQLHQETSFGYIFDKVVDRLVLVGAILVLITLGQVPLWAILLIAKEIVVIPRVVQRGAEGYGLRGLGPLGRFFSLVQGLGVVWLLLNWPGGLVLALVVGGAGLLLGSDYLRELKIA